MDQEKNYIQLIYKLLVSLLAIAFLVVILPYISSVVIMLIFAFLFTTILLPSVDALERKIRNRGLSVLIITVGFIAVISIFIGSFASNLAEQAGEFSQRLQTETFTEDFNSFIENTKSKLPDFVTNSQGDNMDSAKRLNEVVGKIVSKLLTFAGALGSFVFTLIMVLIFMIILLQNYHQFKKSLVGFIPNKYFEIGLRLIYNIEQQVSNYLRGQLLAATSVAIMSIIGLYILNLFGANLTLVIFIGIIAGLANLIPLVGPFIGMLITFSIAIMNNLGVEAAQSHLLFNAIPSPFYLLDIVVMFILVQQIDNNLITPMLVGESVGLHPMMVMIALLIGGTLMGPMGMLFAVPAAGIIKVIGHEISFLTNNAHLL
ncbi:MAG TPA: AI-2E family transporter [Candidatus Marinimicrobia bacterium]|nr:AI-2E family transporter [Candidatus Neomarinimicrobiota bacterium]